MSMKFRSMEVSLSDEGNASFDDLFLPTVRNPFSRYRTSLQFMGVSRTIQSVAYESDINRIVERYKRDGILPPALSQPQFEDVSGLNRDFGELVAAAGSTLQAFSDNESQRHKKVTDDAARAKFLAEQAASAAAGAASDKDSQ